MRHAPPPPEKVEWGVPPWIEGDEKRLVDALALALGAKVHVALGERGGRLAPEAGGGPDEELSALQSRRGRWTVSKLEGGRGARGQRRNILISTSRQD